MNVRMSTDGDLDAVAGFREWLDAFDPMQTRGLIGMTAGDLSADPFSLAAEDLGGSDLGGPRGLADDELAIVLAVQPLADKFAELPADLEQSRGVTSTPSPEAAHNAQRAAPPKPARGRTATPLHEAAQNGDVRAVLAGLSCARAVLDALATRAEGGRGGGRTALHVAAMIGRTHALEALLHAAHNAGGAASLREQLLAADNQEMTALMHAARAGSADSCAVLLHAARDSGGDDAEAEHMRMWGAGLTPLLHVATSGSAEACEALLPAAKRAGVLDAATKAHGRTACVPARCMQLHLGCCESSSLTPCATSPAQQAVHRGKR